MSIIEELFNVLAPHACVGCQTEGDLLCNQCISTLPTLLPRCYRCGRLSDSWATCSNCRRHSSLKTVIVATSYEGLAKQLVYALKFERAKAAADTMARLLSPLLSGHEIEVITHAPTANARVRERGYDQAALLAKQLARRLGVPYRPLLARASVERQVGASREARKQQVANAFRAINTSTFVDKKVMLIDDVITTGATCEAAARALKAAGAGHVGVAVFAAAERSLP